MKAMKKYLAVVLALIMTLALCVTAFADENTKHTITITNTTSETHTFEAYQVFKGEWDDTSKTLSNVEWGAGVNGTALLAALKASTDTNLISDTKNIFTDCATAADVAKVLGDSVASNSAAINVIAEIIGANLTGTKAGTASGTNEVKIEVTGDGYYFVKDVTESGALSYDTRSDYILKVVDDVKIEAKDSTVSVDKTVDDVNDSTETAIATSPNDTGDWDINDDIPYALVGTLPSNYESFKTFTFTFTDTLSKGLTLKEDTIKIEDEQGNNIKAYFTITKAAGANDTTVLTIACTDLKAADATNKYLINGEKITVSYKATLNENAVIGDAGNPNTVTITYSTDPNATGSGTTNPPPTNVTPEDKVTVFTYQLNVNKVDDKNQPLAGAKFTLYKLTASEAASTVEGKTVATGSWTAVGSEVAATKPDDATSYTATWTGLDDGIYKLVETTTPNGYNTAEPVYFEVVAAHEEKADGTTTLTLTIYDGQATETATAGTTTVTFTRGGEHEDVTAAAGVISTTVINNPGAVLPSTGGIGTTIFYIVGAILVIGAGVVLVAKRRVGEED